jgi:ecotin
MRLAAHLMLIATVGAGALPAGAQSDPMKAFPPAEPGMRRLVIRVPAVAAPEDRRVELQVGKVLKVDCNRHQLGVQVTRKVAQGWGYDYFVLGEPTGPVSTRMACPPDAPLREEFVRAPAPALASLRYNPRLPIVVYAPEGVQVRYRIWTAGATAELAPAE